MSRTLDAQLWQEHEDKILYNFIKNCFNLGLTPGEAYDKASELFSEMDNCTDRNANSVRQRWNKIKKDSSLHVDLPFSPDDYLNITTGDQQELDFDNFEPLEVPISDSVPIPAALELVAQSITDYTDEMSLDPYTQILSLVKEMHEENIRLKEENASMSVELSAANQNVERYKKEIQRIKSIVSMVS